MQVENEDLIFTLETLVERFDEEMAPYAVGLTQHLAAAFWRMQVHPLCPRAADPTVFRRVPVRSPVRFFCADSPPPAYTLSVTLAFIF